MTQRRRLTDAERDRRRTAYHEAGHGHAVDGFARFLLEGTSDIEEEHLENSLGVLWDECENEYREAVYVVHKFLSAYTDLYMKALECELGTTEAV